MNFLKKLISLCLVVALASVFFCSCSSNGGEKTDKGPYIKVGERKLSKEYIGYFFYVAQRNMIKEAGFNPGDGGNATEEDIKSFCTSREADYITVRTDKPIEKMLFGELLKVGLMV